MVILSKDQISRYKRNILLPDIGIAGQEKLLEGRVLVIGVGGLGSPAALYLAAAGIGTLGIADYDLVDLSNLQRQILHTTGDVGIKKTDSTKQKIAALNPDVDVRLFAEAMTVDELRETLCQFDFVIDATDNYPSKFLINDLCVSSEIPFSHGGIAEFGGQTMTVRPFHSPCYRCIFGSEPNATDVPPSSSVGVLGSVAGVIGAIQATEAVKCVAEVGSLLTSSLLVFDALAMSFRRIPLQRQDNCSCCGCESSHFMRKF